MEELIRLLFSCIHRSYHLEQYHQGHEIMRSYCHCESFVREIIGNNLTQAVPIENPFVCLDCDYREIKK